MLNRWSALRIPAILVRATGWLFTCAALVLPLGAVAYSAADAWWSAHTNPIALRPEMIRIEAGTFVMGSPETEGDRADDEDQHTVRITRPFWLARTEVTQEMYERVMAEAPFVAESKGVALLGAELPAEDVSWDDALRYCNRLSAIEGLAPAYDLAKDPPTWNGDTNGYRLPTEAEWEFAARGGETTVYVGADAGADVCRQDNVGDASAKAVFSAWGAFACGDGVAGLSPAGTLAANRWGLFDMGGNVAEWTWDAYAKSPAAGEDPRKDEGGSRVFRGGSWYGAARVARVANRRSGRRAARFDSLGFRPARSADP